VAIFSTRCRNFHFSGIKELKPVAFLAGIDNHIGQFQGAFPTLRQCVETAQCAPAASTARLTTLISSAVSVVKLLIQTTD